MPPPTSTLRPSSTKTTNSKTPSSPAENAAPKASAPASATAGGKKDVLQKPDQKEHQKEQDDLNKEIEGVRAKLNDIKSRLSLIQGPSSSVNGAGGAPTDRRSQIRAEMDELDKGRQGSRSERQKTLDQLKRLQEQVKNKVAELNASKAKMTYKSSEEVEGRIATLHKQVESGTLKLIDEKKALTEITSLRRSLKLLSNLSSSEESISADRAKMDELRAVLDDPENKRVQERWEVLKGELEELRREGQVVYEQRSGLFDQRNELQKELDVLYGKKRAASQKYKDDGDAYWTKVQDERKAKADRYRADKAAEDLERQQATIENMRENARIPAFSRELEDCGVLIGYFKRFGAGGASKQEDGEVAAADAKVLEGVKQLEIRKVEDAPIGQQLQKKNLDEEGGWGSLGGGGKKKKGSGGGSGKKSAPTSRPGTPASDAETSTSTKSAPGGGPVNLPIGMLTALLNMSIPPPATKDEIARTVNDLEHKKAWFEANQDLKTKEEVDRVEKQVVKMQKKNQAAASGSGKEGGEQDEEEDEPVAEKAGAKEPLHTVAVAGDATTDIIVEQGEQLPTDPERSPEIAGLDGKLEQVKGEKEKVDVGES